jgi:hypothetical protein
MPGLLVLATAVAPDGPRDYAGIALLVSAVGIAIASVVGAVAALLAAHRAGRVVQEVRTLNELSLGQLGAATETRRIDEIDPSDRTAQETRHMDAGEARGVDQEPADVPD